MGTRGLDLVVRTRWRPRSVAIYLPGCVASCERLAGCALPGARAHCHETTKTRMLLVAEKKKKLAVGERLLSVLHAVAMTRRMPALGLGRGLLL
jgi:hypothetical protein